MATVSYDSKMVSQEFIRQYIAGEGEMTRMTNGTIASDEWYEWYQKPLTLEYYAGTVEEAITALPPTIWQQANNYYPMSGSATLVSTNNTTNNFGNTIFYQYYVTYTVGGNYVPTAAEIAAEEKRVAAQEAAKERARHLLCSLLDEEQTTQLMKDNSFELQVGDRLYRVRPGCRVERLEKTTKKVESYFCIHPDLAHNVPHYDWAISQKLWLETDEAGFLRIANETKAA
jgi:hypothetical protein